MIADDLTIEVRDITLERKGILLPEDISIKAISRHCGVGEWELQLPQEHEMVSYLKQPGSGIIIHTRDEIFMSGPMLKPKINVTSEDPGGMVTFTGVDDNVIIADARAWPLPSQGDITQQLVSNDVREAVAETLMKAYVSANIGPTAPLSRRGKLAQLLTIQPDLGRGPVMQKSPRFTNLAELMTEIAIYADFGWRVVQVGDVLEFQVYQVQDRTQFIRFDMDNGSLEEEEIETGPATLTRAIVAGQQEGAERTLIMRTSTDSLAAEEAYGRKIEAFIDQRQTDDLAELEQAGDTELADKGYIATAVKAIPTDDFTREYNTDYHEGDRVTVVVFNQETVSTITEVALVANSEGVALGISIGDVSGFEVGSSLSARVDDTARRVESLERNLETATSRVPAVGLDLNDVDYNSIYMIDTTALSATIKNWPARGIPNSDTADANNPVGSYLARSTGTVETINTGTRVVQKATILVNLGVEVGRGPLVLKRFRSSDGVTWSPWQAQRPRWQAGTHTAQMQLAQFAQAGQENIIEIDRMDFRPPFSIRSYDPAGVTWWDPTTRIFQTSPAWKVLTLNSPWVAYSSPATPPNYMDAQVIRTHAGIIQMRGLVNNGVAGSTICTLPAGYRPSEVSLFLASSTNGSGGAYLRVHANGDVIFVGNSAGATGPGTWVNLEGVTFPAADVAPISAWTLYTLNAADGWTAYDPGWPAPKWWQDMYGRVWNRGLAKRAAGNPATNSIIATMPSANVPNQQIHQALLASGSAMWCSVHYGEAGAKENIVWKPESPPNSTGFVNFGDLLIFPLNRFPEVLWATIVLSGGAGNYNTANYPGASLVRMRDGLIHCRGLIGSVPAGTHFTLAMGPGDRNNNSQMIFATASNSAFARVNLNSSSSGGGAYTLTKFSGNGGWQTLDGLRWIVEG